MGMEPAVSEIYVTTFVVMRATFSLLLSIAASVFFLNNSVDSY